MGPIASPEPIHPTRNVVSPTTAGFTQVGSVPVNSVWMLGGSVPVNNVEVGYKPIAVNNRFNAITEAHDDDDEKWPSLVESLGPPQAMKMAQKEAFWMKAQRKERERRLRSKDDDKLMQTLIDAQGSDNCRTAAPAQRHKVRFCGPTFGPCKDDCCEKPVTGELVKSELLTSKELVKSELLTSKELVKSELLMSEEPVKGSGLVTSVVEAAEAAAPSTLDAEKNMPVAINGIGDAEDVSRSVRWEKGTQKPHEVNGISEDRLTGPVAMRFNISSVQRPLAAASRVASSGNRIVLEGEGGYIESIATGDRIALRLERGVYVFDVILPSGEQAVIALDSGAGVCVWPESWQVDAVLEAKDENLSMIAANGTQISNIGQAVILFRAMMPFTGP